MSPERLYLETKWASLISFELAAHLLKDTLPVAETVNAAGVRNHLHRVAERAEAALGDEKVSFIEGCPREWAALPHPQPPLTVGIDGCYLCAAMGRQEGALRSDRRQINGREWTEPLLRVRPDV